MMDPREVTCSWQDGWSEGQDSPADLLGKYPSYCTSRSGVKNIR